MPGEEPPLKDVLAFEFRYQASQRVFPLALAAFFLFGFTFTATGFGPPNMLLLSPWLVAETIGFLSLFAVFPAAIFTSQAALRDDESGMADLVFATPVSKNLYLGSRYAGALLATLLVLAVGAVGLLAGAFLTSPPAERLGALHPAAFPLALLLIGLPAAAFATSLLFALAIVTRSSLATAVGSLALYFLYFVAAAATGSPLMASTKAGGGGALAIAAWLDPFGLSSFFSHTLHWTAELKNTLLPYGGVLLANRLATLGLAGLLLIFAWRRFRFESFGRGSRRRPPAAVAPAAEGGRPRYSPDTVWASKAALELRHLAAGWPLWVAAALWLLLAAAEIWGNLFRGEYGSALLPTTGALLGRVEEPFGLFGLALLVYFGTELLWLESGARTLAVMDATPARGGALVFAKWLALAALVVGLGLATVLLCVAIQLLKGYFHLEPGVYLAFLATSCGPLLVFAAASLLLHRLAPNRYIGLFLGLLLALAMLLGGGLGLEHHLLRFAGAPDAEYSRLAGFGGSLLPASAFLAYWSLGGLCLALLAAHFWRRGQQPSSGARRWPLALAATAFLAAGGAIFLETNADNGYEPTARRLDWREGYERKYRELAGGPQPTVDHLAARVALFPAESRVAIAGTYLLRNSHSVAISTVFAGVPRNARVTAFESPQATKVETDAAFAFYRLELEKPLAPGENFAIDFELEVAEPTISNGGPDFELLANGSYLQLWRFLPRVGYNDRLAIRDPRERRRRGLPELPPAANAEGGGGGNGEAGDRITFEIEASTESGQTLVGPGQLVRRWEQGGRSHFLYDSAGVPAVNVLALASARYEVLLEIFEGKQVEVYHDGRQPEAARETAAIAADSLAHFAQIFRRPYAYDTLRLAEIPGFWRFGGFATPAAIFLVEDRSFELDLGREASVDLLTRRVAHEVAHQWWGHALTPQGGPGAVVLVEALAKYSESQIVLKRRGAAAARRLLEFELDQYLAGRADATREEVPLAAVDEDAYLFYRKGALATHAIERTIGRDAFRDALAALLEIASPGVEDLIEALESRADPAGRERIGELMRKIVLWDFEIAETRLEHGRLKLEIEAKKWQAEGSGRESGLSFEQEVEIAIETEAGEEIHRLRLQDGRNHVELPAGTAPIVVTVDPDLLFIDKTRWNNRRILQP